LNEKLSLATLVITAILLAFSSHSYYENKIGVNIVNTAYGQDESLSCQDEKTLLMSRIQSWMYRWETVVTDPGGQLRDEGRQIVSEIIPFIQECADVIDADSISKFNMASIIIIDQIDRNVRLGPADVPPGPPIT
jgi:hypothetical protein